MLGSLTKPKHFWGVVVHNNGQFVVCMGAANLVN